MLILLKLTKFISHYHHYKHTKVTIRSCKHHYQPFGITGCNYCFIQPQIAEFLNTHKKSAIIAKVTAFREKQDKDSFITQFIQRNQNFNTPQSSNMIFSNLLVETKLHKNIFFDDAMKTYM
jgi:hypothetical protein